MPTKTIRALNKPLSKQKAETAEKKATAARPKAAPARRTRTAAKPAKAAPAEAAAPIQPETPWRRMDLHMHTPASHDYEQPEKGYLDILKQAERRGLDMIAFTDHNTANGYRNMTREIEDLELLERLGRIRPDELGRLNEYRRLLKKIQVLPGFEFTATFGFHILGVFPPEKPIRDIERVLLDLKVPTRVIDKGLTEAGATSDVLEAYKRIDEAGGMAIAAHANSSAGVAMRDLRLGGQTRIAFTQDPHLRAIEFTDLDKGSRSSSRLFTGIRAEYPRRMHLIQGSDAHRVVADADVSSRPGVGDRSTEVQVEELSFESLRALFFTEDFDKIRPAKDILNIQPDILSMARAAGEGPTVSFVPSVAKKAEAVAEILNHVVAMANGEGGYIFVGCDAKASARKPSGMKDAAAVSEELGEAITKRIFPIPYVTVDLQPGDKGSDIIRVSVPRSLVAPHAIENLTILVRDGAESRQATRDEIMAIARRVLEPQIVVQLAAQQPPQRDPLPPQRESRGGFNRPAQGQAQPMRNGPQSQNRGGPPRDGRSGQAQPSQRQGQPARDGQGNQRDLRQPLARRPEHQPRNPNAQPQHGRRGQPLPAGLPRDDEDEMLLARPVTPVARVEEDTSMSAPAEMAPVQQTGAPSEIDGVGRPGATPVTAAASPVITPAEGAPRTGVEIASVDTRDGIRFFTLRDLRNGSLVRNVTFKSARDLWHYALKQHATGAYAPDKIVWTGDRAILASSERAGKMRYDLALREADGLAHVFYGVIEDGMDEAWRALVGADRPAPAPDTASESYDEPESVPGPDPE